MKNILILITFIVASIFVSAQTNSFHNFTVTDIYGEPYDLSQLKGKKVLVVNVASQCGLTPQYKQLQELYEKYENRDFVIIAFPCNDFGGQEPGTNDDIIDFCEINYGVTFPLMNKVVVKGNNKAPVYKWLTEKQENGIMDAEITWNFQKFMIDENGGLVDCIQPQSTFVDRVSEWIETEEEVGISSVDNNIINLYPNPSKGDVNLNISGNSTVKITDIAGKIIKTFDVRENGTIKFTQAPGMYLIHAENNGKFYTKKLIID